MKQGESISIWFFIGISLPVNGVLILAAGMYELIYPPQSPVVLFHLHAGIWWGGFLAVVGPSIASTTRQASTVAERI